MARLFLFLALLSSLSLACRVEYNHVGKDPDLLVKIYFPGTKPSSRGKAYVWWKNATRAMLPDGAFDVLWMTPKQQVDEYIRVGEYIVGIKVASEGRLRRNPPTHLRDELTKVVDEFFAKRPNLLHVPAPGLERFARARDRAVEKYGSVRGMLQALDISLELTSTKALGIREGRTSAAGGKYIIASDGRAYFLTESEIGKIMKELDLDKFNHGAMGLLINETTSRPLRDLIDYGVVSIGPHTRETSETQENWNTSPERRFPSFRYLSIYR